MLSQLEKMLIRHESLKLKPYRDSQGKLTIGVGRNLDDAGITEDEAYFLMHNNIATTEYELNKFDWFQKLDPVRQDVLIDMTFNLGIPRLLEFKQMIWALQRKDFNKAANEMLDSRWSQEVGKRAVELSEMMRTNNYLEN